MNWVLVNSKFEEDDNLMRATLKQGLLQFSIVSATTAIALTTTTNAWSANLNFVSSRAALGANDYLDWPSTIPQSTSSSLNSANGIGVTVSQAGAIVETRVQNSTPYIIGINSPSNSTATANTSFWNGNFAGGDSVYWTRGSANADGLRLSFDTPVSAVGAQLNSLFYHNSSYEDPSKSVAGFDAFQFRGTITAYNGSTVLGTYSLPGLTTAAADDSAQFYGFTSDAADITSVTFNTTDPFNNDGFNFAINRVSIRTAAQEVPEPFSIVGTLFGGAAALKLRKRLKVTNKL